MFIHLMTGVTPHPSLSPPPPPPPPPDRLQQSREELERRQDVEAELRLQCSAARLVRSGGDGRGRMIEEFILGLLIV